MSPIALPALPLSQEAQTHLERVRAANRALSSPNLALSCGEDSHGKAWLQFEESMDRLIELAEARP